MSDHPTIRRAVFYVVRSHGDLSWYLAFNSQSRAANDQEWNQRPRDLNPEGRSKVLYLQKPSSP